MGVDIQLTQGYTTIVDDIDADLAELNWCAHVKHNRPYAERREVINGKAHTVSLHRIILSRVLGRMLMRYELVDHINNNPLDNRRENLRLASYSQNATNKKRDRDNKSGCKGVYPNNKGKWKAGIKLNKRVHHLGYFDDPVEGRTVYIETAKHYHKEFGRTE